MWTDNPVIRQILGICSALAVTNLMSNTLVMGIGVSLVTAFSSMTVSFLRNIIPVRIRMMVQTLIIAFYVILVDIILRAALPDMSRALGPYVGLIITNCIVMGRAEAFAQVNKPLISFYDGLMSGIGYTLVLMTIALVRELMGFGTVFGFQVLGSWWTQKPGEELNFAAGQYVQIKVPKYGKSTEEVYRAYSIASPPSQRNRIQLIIRRIPHGICTTYVFDYLKEGDTLYLNGAYGDFYLRDTDREIICIAGGSGLAPIKSILHKMEEEKIQRKATFFFGCVGLRDLYYLDEMKAFEEKIPGFCFVPALSGAREEDNWTGETGLITEVVDRYITDGSNAEAYLCGSPGMINACIKVLHSKGITDDRIYYDKF